MIEKLNTALIETFLSHVAPRLNPASVLMDALDISREAAYRRLRGEVAFSFGEAAVLGMKFHFPLDGLLGAGEGTVLFSLRFTDFDESMEFYSRLLEEDIRFFREAAPDPTAVFALASNSLPAELYLRYGTLTRFKLFKWFYQHGLGGPSMREFENLQLPGRLQRLSADYVDTAQLVSTTHYLFDESTIKHWINAVRSFYEMHLISESSVALIREELFSLLGDMEEMASRGAFRNGNPISFYLSDVDLEAAYSYVSTARHRVVGIGIFSLNALRTSDVGMYDYVKNWIQTQSRFATLISRSGELRRIRYIKQQREFVASLL